MRLVSLFLHSHAATITGMTDEVSTMNAEIRKGPTYHQDYLSGGLSSGARALGSRLLVTEISKQASNSADSDCNATSAIKNTTLSTDRESLDCLLSLLACICGMGSEVRQEEEEVMLRGMLPPLLVISLHEPDTSLANSAEEVVSMLLNRVSKGHRSQSDEPDKHRAVIQGGKSSGRPEQVAFLSACLCDAIRAAANEYGRAAGPAMRAFGIHRVSEALIKFKNKVKYHFL